MAFCDDEVEISGTVVRCLSGAEAIDEMYGPGCAAGPEAGFDGDVDVDTALLLAPGNDCEFAVEVCKFTVEVCDFAVEMRDFAAALSGDIPGEPSLRVVACVARGGVDLLSPVCCAW